jgi:thioesterase domain-containing protein/acyl carrier protein
VAPRNELERQLVEIWAQVLNRPAEKIGVNDNFFELGGHSLSAVQLMAKIKRRFNQLLPLAAMFTAPNIAALGTLIAGREATPDDILVPIQIQGSAQPIFGIPGAGGSVFSLRPLSSTLGADQPFYGLQAVGLDGKTLPLRSVEQTAKVNIEAVKTVQPLGPYILLGHSYGGVVAYEMARVLLERGEQVSSLILLDSIAPSITQKERVNDEATDLFEVCTALANLYDSCLEIDIERLRHSPHEENVQYITELLNDRGLEIGARQFAALYSVYRANLLCNRTYNPSKLSRKINASLYVATPRHKDGLTMPGDYGWNELLQSPVLIYEVESNHFSILRKAHILGSDREIKPVS